VSLEIVTTSVGLVVMAGEVTAMLMALVMLFGGGYIWHSTFAMPEGSALLVNRSLALVYLFVGELAMLAWVR
jgi:hypothetical protein